ncbi:MAG: hypothetical protein E3J43_02580 [Candidatus Heimdallarchaeota archaeon]|nr:MAG: hypothetical protein E3J43_02580 [Candidatus Heimdallarchaeota archaeon]
MKLKTHAFLSSLLIFSLVSCSIVVILPSDSVNSYLEVSQTIELQDLYQKSTYSNIVIKNVTNHFTINATDYRNKIEVRLFSVNEIFNNDVTIERQMQIPIRLEKVNFTSPLIVDAGYGNLTTQFNLIDFDDFGEYSNIELLTNITFLGYSTIIVSYELNFLIEVREDTKTIELEYNFSALRLWGIAVNKTVIFDIIGEQTWVGHFSYYEEDIIDPEVSNIENGTRYRWDIRDDFERSDHLYVLYGFSEGFDLSPAFIGFLVYGLPILLLVVLPLIIVIMVALRKRIVSK